MPIETHGYASWCQWYRLHAEDCRLHQPPGSKTAAAGKDYANRYLTIPVTERAAGVKCKSTVVKL